MTKLIFNFIRSRQTVRLYPYPFVTKMCSIVITEHIPVTMQQRPEKTNIRITYAFCSTAIASFSFRRPQSHFQVFSTSLQKYRTKIGDQKCHHPALAPTIAANYSPKSRRLTALKGDRTSAAPLTSRRYVATGY